MEEEGNELGTERNITGSGRGVREVEEKCEKKTVGMI